MLYFCNLLYYFIVSKHSLSMFLKCVLIRRLFPNSNDTSRTIKIIIVTMKVSSRKPAVVRTCPSYFVTWPKI